MNQTEDGVNAEDAGVEKFYTPAAVEERKTEKLELDENIVQNETKLIRITDEEYEKKKMRLGYGTLDELPVADDPAAIMASDNEAAEELRKRILEHEEAAQKEKKEKMEGLAGVRMDEGLERIPEMESVEGGNDEEVTTAERETETTTTTTASAATMEAMDAATEMPRTEEGGDVKHSDDEKQLTEDRELMDEFFYSRYNSTTEQVDLVFVLDRSGSVPDNGWKAIVEFVKV